MHTVVNYNGLDKEDRYKKTLVNEVDVNEDNKDQSEDRNGNSEDSIHASGLLTEG